MKVTHQQGKTILELHQQECEILVDLIEEFLIFLDEKDQPDPARARLFPAAYADDDDNEEFRRYSEPALLERKISDARLVTSALSRTNTIEISQADLDSWLRAFNDVRLTLGTRLNIEGDDELRFPDDDPRAFLYSLYGWLGWLQASLLGE